MTFPDNEREEKDMAEPTIHQLFDLSGRVALISGASGFLGTAMSMALAEAGATVVTTSRDPDRARAAAERLPGEAPHVGVQMDHMDSASVEEGFAAAVAAAGAVDILVNNGNDSVGIRDLTDVDAESFDRTLSNATGYFLLSRLIHDHAVERGVPASIILLGSMYGVVGSYPDAYEGVCMASPVAYHALKGGIIHMTRHLGVYWAKDNVRVNCLSPGPFPNMEKAPAEMVTRLCTKSPMGRMGLPHELKGAAVFLASDASSYMTGQNMIIDGGWTAW
jgi:NAD(P)-dependent dehydrogenase (short-subunit alcohol dehydrogenase family)